MNTKEAPSLLIKAATLLLHQNDTRPICLSPPRFLVFSYTSAVLSLQYSFPFGFLLLFSNLWSIPCVSFGEGLLLVHFKVRCELCEERDFPLKCQRMVLILITSTGNIVKIWKQGKSDMPV